MKQAITRCILTTACALLLAGPARADVLQLKDGRTIEGKKLEKVEGGVNILFSNGTVFVPDAQIGDVMILNEDGSFKPRNAKEKKMLEKGFVPFQGRWIPKSQYARKLKQLEEEAKERIAKAQERRVWRSRGKKKTKNFAFEYTIPDELAHEYHDLFETYYKVFTKHWGIRRPKKMGRLKVCFYHDAESFQQVGGVGPGVLGYFRYVAPIELNVFNVRNDKALTIEVIFHEVNHYLFHLLDPKFHYPPWVGEGLAEYYAMSDWDPKAKKMTVGKLQEGRLIQMKDDIDDGNWLGLEEMINMQQATGKHYSWGWSFCHFLMESKKYSKKFKKMVKALSKSRGIDRVPYGGDMLTVSPEETFKAFKKYLGVSTGELEKQWHGYIKQSLAVSSSRGFEAAARMARRNGMRLKAKKFYKKAVEADNPSARCLRAYGEMLTNDGKTDEAIKLIERAIKIDPVNPYGHLYLANALARKGGDGNKKKAKTLRQLALEIAPDDEELEAEAELTVRLIKP